MYSLDNIFKNIREVIANVVIKYDSKGKKYDTLEIKRDYDIYKLALEEQDSFYLYPSFDQRALEYAGIINEEELASCLADKNNIPVEKREYVLYYQRYITVSEYEEKNNYYRMLNGLPDIEDEDFIYIDIGIADELDIDYTIPIHKLSLDEILRVEHVGELDRIKSKYNKPYLEYLGSKKIDVITARDASNFAIIRLNNSDSDTFHYEFQKIYAQCREYFMSVLFIKEYSTKYEYYDSFIAMSIMVMAIQRMFVNTFKYGIDRDFYDLASIKLLFDSYNVPFIEDLPITYQRTLMKNLNNLLKYKSSDKVLYDICDILGFNNINIYKYFLSKEHIMDNEGNPVFFYKDVIDEVTGKTTTVFDKEKMFNFKWKSVELKERDVPSALLETTNSEDYESVISDDPFWIDDDNLRTRLYESEFNYIESKYLKMNIMYNLSNVIFDTIYAFRMLTDKRNDTANLTITLPKLFESREIPLFNVIMLLTALICKKNKLKGNIITKPSQTLSVLGFNFKADFMQVKEFIKDNSKWVDQTILEYFNHTKFNVASDVNECYNDIIKLHDYLSKALRNATTKKDYDVHKKLYDTLLITELSKEIYTKSDGQIATTYLEFLQDIDVDLYAYVVGVNDADITDNLDHIILQLNGLIESLDNFYYLNNDNNVLLNALIKLIDFFKSYTTDLTSFNILYVSNDPVGNLIKMMSDINSIDKNTFDKHRHVIKDKVKIVLTEFTKKDLYEFRDIIADAGTYIYYNNLYKFIEKISFRTDVEFEDIIYLPFSDLQYLIECELRLRDSLLMADTIKIIYET